MAENELSEKVGMNLNFEKCLIGSALLGLSFIASTPAEACPGGGNWCSYHPVRSGDSTGHCQHIAVSLARGEETYDPNRKCHVGHDVMTYSDYILAK